MNRASSPGLAPLPAERPLPVSDGEDLVGRLLRSSALVLAQASLFVMQHRATPVPLMRVELEGGEGFLALLFGKLPRRASSARSKPMRCAALAARRKRAKCLTASMQYRFGPSPQILSCKANSPLVCCLLFVEKLPTLGTMRNT